MNFQKTKAVQHGTDNIRSGQEQTSVNRRKAAEKDTESWSTKLMLESTQLWSRRKAVIEL